MTIAGQKKPTDLLDAATQRFVLWCLEAFGLRLEDTQGVFTIEPSRPSEDSAVPREELPRSPFPELVGKRFTFQTAAQTAAKGPHRIEHVTLTSTLFCWLLEQLRRRTRPLDAVPAKQPVSVHELADSLFSAYQVDRGHVHLAGCSLEERPFLRLTYLDSCPEQVQLIHCFAADDGTLLDTRLQERLELSCLTPLLGRFPRLDDSVLQRWVEVARQRCRPAEESETRSLIATTLLWCKHAQGKLALTIDRKSVEIAFSGWARLLLDKHVVPPPYTCPWTGKQSYHLAATDDGRITVAEAIATCEESGERVLETELETCAVSGRRVLLEYVQTCPLSGARILKSLLETCTTCGQSIDPRKMVNGRCEACRSLRAVSKDDPRMARILGTFPKLDRWRSWKLSETDAVYVLVGASLWKRLLLVLDKHSLDVLRVATSGRFRRRWCDVTDLQQSEWLDG